MTGWAVPRALLTVVLLLAVVVVTAAEARELGAGPLVSTVDGPMLGRVTAKGGTAFEGIPYAAPPVGDLRWQPPRPPARWRGMRAAVRPAAACAQGLTETTVRRGSQDCLYLNVYRPAGASARTRLPVLMWLHGGGYQVGAGSDVDGSRLAAFGRVIVVTLNYRLGPFGFLALPGDSGDFGLMDQQAALRWVRDNIAAFGGAPGNVTLFGESSGGISVCLNLISPAAAGLFQRAITESGPCARQIPTLAAARQRGLAFATSEGCTVPDTALACLRRLSMTRLLDEAQENLFLLDGRVDGWFPDVDGTLVPEQPPAAIAAGRFNRVPVLVGTNLDEGRFHVAIGYDLDGGPITAVDLPTVLDRVFGARAAAVAAEYPVNAYGAPDLAVAAAVTDSAFAVLALLADQQLSRWVPAYAYEFADEDAPAVLRDPYLRLGASHESEIQYVFDAPPRPWPPAQQRLAERIMTDWSTFARYGSPPRWPAFTAAAGDVQELTPPGQRPPTQAFAAQHRFSFWTRSTDGA